MSERTQEHAHSWMPVGIVTDGKMEYSPVSRRDDRVVVSKFAVQSCECGAVKRTLIGSSVRPVAGGPGDTT